MENFKLTGKQVFINYAMYNLAIAYHCNEDYEASIELSKQLLDTVVKYNDEFLGVDPLRQIALSSFAMENYKEALKYYDYLCRNQKALPRDSIYLAMAYIRSGDIQNGYRIMNKIPLQNSVHDHWLRYNVYMIQDSIKQALAMMSKMNSDIDSVLDQIKKQNLSGALYDYKSYRDAVAKANIRAGHILAWCIVVVSILIISWLGYFFVKRYRRQRQLIARNIEIARNLRDIIAENNHRADSLISSLLSERFEEIDKLCQDLYEKKSSNNRKKLSESIDNFIYSYSKDKKRIAELENYADTHYDGIISKLRIDFPDMIENDRLFIFYSRLGFSNTSIA